ncbi:hypothetical protein ES708_25167 [subsurface metagenome]
MPPDPEVALGLVAAGAYEVRLVMIGAIVDCGGRLAGVLVVAGIAHWLALVCRAGVSTIGPVPGIRRHNRLATEGANKILAQFLAFPKLLMLSFLSGDPRRSGLAVCLLGVPADVVAVALTAEEAGRQPAVDPQLLFGHGDRVRAQVAIIIKIDYSYLWHF